ncbi:MAG: ABC transporter ATP-binding protein [Alkalinema sp. RU_4_3]|nr:ABC transporter ATP-binding protein [Alkalinema sp. RU_4_3]
MAKILDIARYFRHYKGVAVFSGVAMCVMEIVDLFSPYGIGQLLNALSNQPLDGPMKGAIALVANTLKQPVTREFSLLVILGMIGLVSVGRAPIQPWLGPWFNWDTALKARRDHAKKSLEKVLTLPLEFYDENNPGRVATRIGKGLSNHTWTYPEVVGNLIPKVVRVFGIFGVICFVDWRIAVLLLVSFVGILAYSLLGLKSIADREERLDKYIENTESRTSEIITNIKTVKAFATEADELKRQKQRLEREFVISDYRIHKSYVKLAVIERTIVQTCMFIVLALTLFSTMQGRISLGHFVTVLTVSSMAFAEVEPICNLAEIFARRYASMIRYHEFMQLPTGQDAGSLVHTGQGDRYQFTGKLHFRQLNFSYIPGRPILQNIDLLIHPKQTVALVGRSGSGKSTLVKLLFRYFDAQGGDILIDGQDIRSLDVSSYRKRLAIVHQEVDVFNGTLWDNLLYGNRGANPEQVLEACRIAQADDFIKQLPQGYQTMVGERGVRLSGGQRQRLGIARALIMDPDVLVFDEATSSLDYESERSIQLAMKSLYGTRTMIIIAHRLSTVREADQIVVLDRGQIQEVGDHQSLLQGKGIYARLNALQETGELLV